MSKKLKNRLILYLILLILTILLSFFELSRPNLLTNKDEGVSCRIGMTTDPERRKREWEGEYRREGKTVINWKILSVHKSKLSAQKAETKTAKEQNCIAHPEGRNSEKEIWYVYKIEY